MILADQYHCNLLSIGLHSHKNQMNFLTIFLILFFLLVIYILLAPIALHINTTKNEYFIQLPGLVKASIEEHKKELLRIKLKVLFLNFYFYPLRKNSDGKKQIEKRRTRSRKISMQTGLRVLRSFKIKRLYLDVDTGDSIANAKLFPLFAFINYKIGGFNINFEGRNRMILYIQNRPIHIIKSFINF